ncbi:hypothetical protein HY605_01065 [Candidatus Peregrinibacteria bacterium]|nr:hypothetical protein [Candidatus Peregrinibacteria bacterium]
MKNKIQEFFKQYPRRMINGEFNENVSGDNLLGCKDTFESYDSTSLRDSKFCTNMLEGGNDCYDINLWGGNTSMAYNSAGIGSNCQNIIASYYVCFNASDIYHSAFCLNNVKNFLGCVGLRQKQYCILNKQYSKEEYEKLVPKIIESMKTSIKGGWGEFSRLS